MRLDWRRLAASSQTYTSLRCLVPRLARSTNSLFSRKVRGVMAIIHWTVWCAPDCPASRPRPRQRSVAQSASDAWPAPTVTRTHRTIRCTKGAMAATVGCARKGRRSHTVHCLVVHRTIQCAHGQKDNYCLQMELQRLLTALGL
jgi:hypothetical protein